MDSVIIYARVSSKEQEAEGFSIPAQLKQLHEYATKHNYLVAREFTDVETAKRAGRTQFSEMLRFLEANRAIKHILVEKTDRLLRNISDYALLEMLIEDLDTRIHLVKENTVLSRESRSNEKFIFGIKALMAKNYIDNLSEEVRKGMTEKAAQGTYPSVAPYGYLNSRVDGKKVIATDPQAAPFVKKMFELYATGEYSFLSLRKKMLGDGMVYRNGKNFYKSAVENILKNEFYTGVFLWMGKKYENASHEAIITKELFQLVQKKRINPLKSKSKKDLFTYSSLITCGSCGCSLTAEIKKEKYIYYHCTGHRGNCGQPYVRQEVIEAKFEEILASIQISDEIQNMIMQGLREGFMDKIEYHNNLVATIEHQIKVLQNRIDQAYLDKLDGKIGEDFWKAHTKRWLEEKEGLSIRLLASQKADTKHLENANLILELSKTALVLFKRQNSEQKRRLIMLLISNCSYKDENIDVQLKPVFEKIVEASKTGKWCARQGSNLQPADSKSDTLSN